MDVFKNLFRTTWDQGLYNDNLIGYRQGYFLPNKNFNKRDSRSPPIKIPGQNYMEHLPRYPRSQNIPEFIYKRILKRTSSDLPEIIYKRIL